MTKDDGINLKKKISQDILDMEREFSKRRIELKNDIVDLKMQVGNLETKKARIVK